MRHCRFALAALATSLLATACAVTPSDEDSSDEQTISALGLAQPGPVPGIPTTGQAKADFAPVDDAIRRFMRERCVGSAVIGIAYNGIVVHNRGYGYKDGPPSAACATATDPFVGGEQVQPNTPFRIGSNSKAVLAAVVRLELKKALAAKRRVRVSSVSDADIEALRLIDNGEIELVSPKVRAAMLAKPAGSFTTKACPIVNPWPKVTIGQLLQHRSGLPRSGEDVYEELSKIRALSSAATLAAQEAASGAPAGAKTELKDKHGQSAYFVPPNTLEEYAIAQGNRCFANEPGSTTLYSNSGFGMLEYVVEHVTGKPFNATNGVPLSHYGSLLSNFTGAELGFGYGIQLSHAALGARDPAEPRYRDWSGSNYYPTERDEKRPWCILSGLHCEFDQWASGKTRFNWNWQEERVPLTYGSNIIAGGVGALAASAPRYLAFMKRFSVATPYGKDRTLFAQSSNKEHRGALDGTASWVAQLNSGSLSYKHFADRPNGTMSFDLQKATSGSCSLPKGIDVFFAMNQRSDAKCTTENECVVCEDAACTDTTSAYGLYANVIKEALCAATWNPPMYFVQPQ